MSKVYSKPNLRVLGNTADDEQLQLFHKPDISCATDTADTVC
jgi:hypothetical protein